MKEKSRPIREIFGSGAQASGDIFAVGAADGAVVTVAHGPYAEQLPVGNMSVREIRTRYRDRFDIDPHSVAVLDGGLVDDDTLVRAEQTLMFIRRAGEKGCAAAFYLGSPAQALSLA